MKRVATERALDGQHDAGVGVEGGVRIPELDDGEEYVVIENRGSADADLDGWTLSY